MTMTFWMFIFACQITEISVNMILVKKNSEQVFATFNGTSQQPKTWGEIKGYNYLCTFFICNYRLNSAYKC